MGCKLQRLRRQWLLPLTALAVSFILPSQLGGMKFIPIYESLTIRAQKNSPPHIAFETLFESESAKGNWGHIEKKPVTTLATHQTGEIIRSPSALLAKKVVLEEMVLEKTSEILIAEAEEFEDVRDRSWAQSLSEKQVVRLEEAQKRTAVLNQDWKPPQLAELAHEALTRSGMLDAPVARSKYYVSAQTPSGEIRNQVPSGMIDWDGSQKEAATQAAIAAIQKGQGDPQDEMSTLNFSGNVGRMQKIVGPLEITGGLAVTNEHHFEVRRNDRGVYKELGRVDLQKGLYNIEVDDPSGTVVARLVTKEGKILGEGSFRLSLLPQKKNDVILGPKIKIEPHADYAGIVASAYNSKAEDSAPPQTRVTFVKGASEVSVKKDGVVAMDNVVKKSSTVMRAAAPSHLQTAAIVISGQEFKTLLYPEKMITALQNIVFQQKNMTPDQGAPQVIWGQVKLDGKSVAGIDVVNESDPDLQPVYFNQFMIPDPQLKSTSENGLFAFVGAEEGFHSLLATRAGAIFGYQNVVVEANSVAQGDIDSSIRKEPVAISIYDAFSGTPMSSIVTLQSLEAEQDVLTGSATFMLSPVSRLGLLRAQPLSAEYVAAKYLYNDADSYIHVPLVKWTWLNTIKTYLKLDDMPSTGVVVGFVTDEDFEVYLAGYDDFAKKNIVYFDMQGRILQTGKGLGGGGFILFNTPADTHEVVVIGEKSKKIYTKVVPVEASSLGVLTFRE